MSKGLEIMGPSLRLIYKYLGQPDLTDADKIAFAGALLNLVGDHQAETQQEVRAAIDAAGIVVERLVDWGPEDDRLVLIGQIADTIERMPTEKLQRVLEAARRIRDEPDPSS